MIRTISFFLFFSLTLLPFCFSQDSLVQEKSTTAKNLIPQKINDSSQFATEFDSTQLVWMTPKKTALFSAILPGLGQVYNKQYWKLPIIYGGLGVAAYFISDNLKNYNTFRQVYAGRVSGDPKAFQKFPEYPLDVIKNARDSYRQDLDLTVLLTIVGYGLQVIDAIVFAQLKNFDVSPDISIRTKPVATPQGGLGIGIVMNF